MAATASYVGGIEERKAVLMVVLVRRQLRVMRETCTWSGELSFEASFLRLHYARCRGSRLE